MSEETKKHDINSKYTLWRLLNEYKVEIPIIQRDYAQGRTSENVTAIREDLLVSIYNALTQQKPLDFDFVYGTVEGDTLYPLDGQQRLTTFYLLYWYIAEKEDRMEDASPILSKFTYTTRTSSREFCEMLSELEYCPKEGKKVSEYIKNENGYFRSWNTDPTITHMLTMLDAIHEKFFNTGDLFDLLIADEESAVLTFNYLPMEHYALTDDLYIKMNARGKALSVFENFKAKFIQHQKEFDLPYEHFEEQIDGAWTDLLWDYRSKDNTIDKQFMNLFCYLTEMLYLETEAQREGDSPFRPHFIRKLINYYQDENVVEALYGYLDLWKSKEEASAYLNSILSAEPEREKVRVFDGKADIFSSVINGEYVTLSNKILLFSIMKRLVTWGKDTDITAMKDYARIIRNYLLNIRSFIRKKCSFSPDLRYGRHAIPIMQHFVSILAESEYPYEIMKDTEFEAVNSEICHQEAVKAGMILDRPELKALIQELEDLDLFRGTIFNVLPYIEENEDDCLVDNIINLFTKDNGIKLIQAMLSIKDYGIKVGNSMYGDRYFYGDIRNWYSILTYSGGKSYAGFISEFIRQYEETEAEYVQDALSEIIVSNLSDIKKNDWRYTVINYDSTMEIKPGFIDNYYYVFAMECCEDGTMLPHRSNGFIMNGYHVIPEYAEIKKQLGSLCAKDVRGFGSEKDGSVYLTCAEGLSIGYGNTGRLWYDNREEDDDWVSETIGKFEQTDTSELDRVEKAVLLARMLNEKCNEVNG